MEPERATQVRMRPGQLTSHVARLDAEIIRVKQQEVGVSACREPPLVRQAEKAGGVRTSAQDGSRRVGRAGLEVQLTCARGDRAQRGFGRLGNAAA